MSGIECVLVMGQVMALINGAQDLVIAGENHTENQQRSQENRQFTRESHEENQRSARENQKFSREKHNDNREFAREDQQFSKENHRHKQRVAIENQWFASEKQERDLLIQRSKMKNQLALKEKETEQIRAETEKLKAENVFRRCLVSNIHNSDLGSSRIPKVCEDSARVFRLLAGGSEVDELIEAFQK